jgi:trehalose utilization protein
MRPVWHGPNVSSKISEGVRACELGGMILVLLRRVHTAFATARLLSGFVCESRWFETSDKKSFLVIAKVRISA